MPWALFPKPPRDAKQVRKRSSDEQNCGGFLLLLLWRCVGLPRVGFWWFYRDFYTAIDRGAKSTDGNVANPGENFAA